MFSLFIYVTIMLCLDVRKTRDFPLLFSRVSLLSSDELDLNDKNKRFIVP